MWPIKQRILRGARPVIRAKAITIAWLLTGGVHTSGD